MIVLIEVVNLDDYHVRGGGESDEKLEMRHSLNSQNGLRFSNNMITPGSVSSAG